MTPVALPGVAQVVTVSGFPARHGFSTTALGSLGLTEAQDPDLVMERRRRLAEQIPFEPERAVFAAQVHGAAVRVFRRQDGATMAQSVLDTDALVSDVRGQALLTYHADCYPVLFADRASGAVGAAHAGWRGTLEGVAFATVRAFKDGYGTTPDNLDVLIGPGICAACYEVGPEVAAAFRERDRDADRYLEPSRDDRLRLDLRAALRQQLESCGVRPERIVVSGWCTREDPRWFSHRGGRPGRFVAAVVAP